MDMQAKTVTVDRIDFLASVNLNDVSKNKSCKAALLAMFHSRLTV